MRTFNVHDIEWDTDGEDFGLPTETRVSLEEGDLEGLEREEIEEKVLDWLSDEYEYCIDGCYIEEE